MWGRREVLVHWNSASCPSEHNARQPLANARRSFFLPTELGSRRRLITLYLAIRPYPLFRRLLHPGLPGVAHLRVPERN